MNSMYFIALVLPEDINQKILGYKKYMFENYKCQVAMKSPAHITLIPPFWMKEDLESFLIRDLDSLAGTFHAFELSAHTFSGFHPRTIFIAPEESRELKELKTITDDFFKRREEYKMEFDSRPFHPHITIASRDLHKKDYYVAMDYFKQKDFSAHWMTDTISVLKHNKKNWDVVHSSQFQNL